MPQTSHSSDLSPSHLAIWELRPEISPFGSLRRDEVAEKKKCAFFLSFYVSTKGHLQIKTSKDFEKVLHTLCYCCKYTPRNDGSSLKGFVVLRRTVTY